MMTCNVSDVANACLEKSSAALEDSALPSGCGGFKADVMAALLEVDVAEPGKYRL